MYAELSNQQHTAALCLLFVPTDLELMEGLDVSKHGERAMPVRAFVKELEASVHGGRKATESPTVTVV
jgi:hypothetical protein